MALLPYLVLAMAVAAAVSHPTVYPDVNRAYACRWMSNFENGTLPRFRSFHIHILYVNHDTHQHEAAQSFRKKLIDHFGLANDTECLKIYHNDRLCVFSQNDWNDPDAAWNPFALKQWAIFIPIERYYEVTTWVMQNRGDNVVLLHPNSGYEKMDHLKWSTWQGGIYPMRESALCSDCGDPDLPDI